MPAGLVYLLECFDFMVYPKSVERLYDKFRMLPGIGQKSAMRLALFILKMSDADARSFANAVLEVKSKITSCSVCNNITECDPCNICADLSRDHSLVCVVEESTDLFAIENTHGFKGLYHVLHGVISPLNGVQPEDLKIAGLIRRLQKGEFSEVVMATSPNMEGETTALYIKRLIMPFGIKVTRIARGIPVGGSLEHADPMTIAKGFEGRTVLDD